MKVKKILDLKNKYSFEAPLHDAVIAAGLGKKKAEFDFLDLNQLLAPDPGRYFLVKVSGESMIDENILDGDVLVVDRIANAEIGNIVISALNGEMTVKKLMMIEGKMCLQAANKKYVPIEIDEFMQFTIQGVVKHVIRNM